MGPVRGFVIPTLKAIGLYSERIHGFFHEMFVANIGRELAEATSDIASMPEDLEAWVEEGA